MYHVLLGCYPVSISLFPMRFSRGYFYKCLLADQTAPCPQGGLKLMLGRGGGEKEWKREAIILPILPPSLPPLRSAGSSSSNHMVPTDMLWVLGERQSPAAPSGFAGGPFASPPLPILPWHSFLHRFPYRTSASVSPSWPAPPVLHYGAEHNTRTETGKLYFIRQPRSAPETPLELIHSAAFDSLLPRGCVEVLGALQEGHLKDFLSRFECTELRLNQAPVIASLLSCAAPLWAIHWHRCNQSHLTQNWQTHNGLSALAFVIHFVSRTCL